MAPKAAHVLTPMSVFLSVAKRTLQMGLSEGGPSVITRDLRIGRREGQRRRRRCNNRSRGWSDVLQRRKKGLELRMQEGILEAGKSGNILPWSLQRALPTP